MFRLFLLLLVAIAIGGVYFGMQNDPEVHELSLYSSIERQHVEPLLDAYTKKTGVKVNLFAMEAEGLVNRLESEGKLSPADVVMVADVTSIVKAEEKGLLQPYQSTLIDAQVPAKLRDSDQQWFGFAKRVRAFIVGKYADEENYVKGYEDLADEKWKGRVWMPDSQSASNQMFLAYMIEHHGEEKAEQWAKKLVANFAQSPEGSDYDQLMNMGDGGIAVVNSFPLAKMEDALQESENYKADLLEHLYPNQEDGDTGAHINIHAAGMTTATINKEEATQLLEFLVSEEAQYFVAKKGSQFPVVATIEPASAIQKWGAFAEDETPLEVIATHSEKAIELMEKAGWK